MKKKAIRKGSMADKVMNACDWVDNTAPGRAVSYVLATMGIMAVVLYGFQCTHPFI